MSLYIYDGECFPCGRRCMGSPTLHAELIRQATICAMPPADATANVLFTSRM